MSEKLTVQTQKLGVSTTQAALNRGPAMDKRWKRKAVSRGSVICLFNFTGFSFIFIS